MEPGGGWGLGRSLARARLGLHLLQEAGGQEAGEGPGDWGKAVPQSPLGSLAPKTSHSPLPPSFPQPPRAQAGPTPQVKSPLRG